MAVDSAAAARWIAARHARRRSLHACLHSAQPDTAVIIAVAAAELAQARERLQVIYAKLGNAREATLPRVGRTDDGALIVAGYLETWYTVLETFFVRVSGYFENHLPPGRWHTALLENMTLEIEGARARVVSDHNLGHLRELLRFRHFRRHYVEMEYDWARIDFLLTTLDAAHPAALRDLDAFDTFLREVRRHAP